MAKRKSAETRARELREKRMEKKSVVAAKSPPAPADCETPTSVAAAAVVPAPEVAHPLHAFPLHPEKILEENYLLEEVEIVTFLRLVVCSVRDGLACVPPQLLGMVDVASVEDYLQR